MILSTNSILEAFLGSGGLQTGPKTVSHPVQGSFFPPMDGGEAILSSPPRPLQNGGMRKIPPQTSPEWVENNLDFSFRIPLYTKIFAACGGHIPKFSSPAAGSHTINYTKSFFATYGGDFFVYC